MKRAQTHRQRPPEFTARLEVSRSKIYATHIRVPDEIAHALTKDGSRRVFCELSTEAGATEYQCGLIPSGDGSFVIMVNKERRERLGLQAEMSLKARLRADSSEYGLPMPEELEETLNQDPAGNEFFQALSPGKRRSLMYLVAAAKSVDKRIAKALIIVEHLKALRGALDYKRLNEELKRSISIQKGIL